jgi:hypothetical protein
VQQHGETLQLAAQGLGHKEYRPKALLERVVQFLSDQIYFILGYLFEAITQDGFDLLESLLIGRQNVIENATNAQHVYQLLIRIIQSAAGAGIALLSMKSLAAASEPFGKWTIFLCGQHAQ